MAIAYGIGVLYYELSTILITLLKFNESIKSE